MRKEGGGSGDRGKGWSELERVEGGRRTKGMRTRGNEKTRFGSNLENENESEERNDEEGERSRRRRGKEEMGTKRRKKEKRNRHLTYRNGFADTHPRIFAGI